ncbi:MAG: alcohol dehydrogenase catalytic domain-containing protein [Acidimicrobiales bacterium]
MRAAIYREFCEPVTVEEVPHPDLPLSGVVIEVKAAGVCRSDVWGWQGSDPDIDLPNVGGHEFAGVVAEVGALVSRFAVGDRVTVPFCCGCGSCSMCKGGNSQVCNAPFQPGFTAWGCYAQFVAVPDADRNLVLLPSNIEFVEAALLGCRFITAFRAVVERGRIQPGRSLSVHGCGGLGLSVVMIAAAMGAQVVAIDLDDVALDRAKMVGAASTINVGDVADVASTIRDLTNGGAHCSIDAVGSQDSLNDALGGLRKLGRHVQAGLFEGASPRVAMNLVIANELELLGTHGMASHRYAELFEMMGRYDLDLSLLVERVISLDEVPGVLAALRDRQPGGVAVISDFGAH